MEDITIIPSPKKILYIGYNYNSFYFTLGTDIGFQVYQTFPLALKFSRILKGGIGIVQVLLKSNIFCLVGGGKSPKYAPNKLIIWDDKKRKEVYDIRFNSFILNCFIKNKYIFIICFDTLNIVSKENLKILERISTIENPKGIGAISSATDKYILCWPDLAKGKIAIKDFCELKNNSIAISTHNSINNSIFGKKLTFKAHTSNINIISLSKNGNILATSSEKGSAIRIFDTVTGKMMKEIKTCIGGYKIYTFNFSFNDKFLGVTSDHGSADIFIINNNENNVNDDFYEVDNDLKINIENKENDSKISEQNIINENKTQDFNDFTLIGNVLEKSEVDDKKLIKNNTSILNGVSKIIGLNNMFQSEWFFSQFNVPYKVKSFISFLGDEKNNNKVVVIDKNGNYTVAEINDDKETKIIKKDCLL